MFEIFKKNKTVKKEVSRNKKPDFFQGLVSINGVFYEGIIEHNFFYTEVGVSMLSEKDIIETGIVILQLPKVKAVYEKACRGENTFLFSV